MTLLQSLYVEDLFGVKHRGSRQHQLQAFLLVGDRHQARSMIHN